MKTHWSAHLGSFRSAIGAALLAGCAVLTAGDFFVDALGNDANPGTKESPFATIEAARDAVRKAIAGGMKEDIVVHIGAGNYFVEKTIELDDRDSGRDGRAITYKGAPDLGTRIFGGRRITNWTKLNDKEFVAEVPDLQQHFMLYENDQAANGGIFHTFQDAPEGNWKREGTRLIYHPRNLPIENQILVLGTAKDVFSIKGRSMEQIAGNIVFDGLHMIGSDFAPEWKKGDSYASNWDGEYDGKPWGGKTLCDSVIAPDMRHGQFYIENARNVVVRNSRLYGAGFMGVMFNRWAQECRMENNWIENAGCNGLFFMGWECGRGPFKTVAESYVNKKHVVRNNVFHDIGRFSNYGAGMYFNFSGDNLVEHNVFHGITHYGVTLKGWRPRLINAFYSVNSGATLENPDKIAPYDVQELKLYGEYVVTEANQGAEVLHSRNTIVRYNDMSQIARSGDDMGMISMWGAGTGNVWEYNACHDGVNTSGWDHWLHVLFNDDGSHLATVRGNIVYWITGGGRSRAIMAKGNEQLNIYNIIADCDLSAAATIGPYIEQAHHMVWSNNIVAAQIQTLYEGGQGTEKVGGEQRPILKAAEKNVYFYQPLDRAEPSSPGAEKIQQQVTGRNKAKGIDADSIYADPLFDRKRPWWDAHYTEYLLKPDSPALKLGFKQTDMSKIGIQEGFPFDLAKIIGQPAGKTRKAADFSRIFKNRITNQQVRSRHGSPLYRNSWTRYNGVDFGEGRRTQFRTRLEWVAPKQTFDKTVEGATVNAMELGDDWRPIPYWEVSPAYNEKGKTGPELFEVAFAPEKEPDAVKWKPVIEPLVSRATVRHPLGVVNCDVVNGENNANSAAYMRASLYAKSGGKTDVEIRGAHGVKVWLNGVQVFSQLGNVGNSKRVDMTFKKGWNQFLVKVVQDDKPWAPAMQGYGNFWATVTLHYIRVGGAFLVPGLPGNERFIDPHQGAAVEIRLDAPDGKLIGTLPFKQNTCKIEKTTGRHDLFLVFPNENVQMMDWFRFE